LAADVVRGLALAGMAALSLTGNLALGSLAALTALYGAGTAFFGPAFDAIIPDVVPARLLPQANSLDQLIKPLGLRLFGPALGGLLVGTWGPGVAFAADALTFAVSAGALMMMSHRTLPSSESTKTFLSELRTGYSFVRKHVWLWGTFSAAALAYLLFMGPAEVLLPYIVKVEMKGSASDLGLIFAIGGVGSILSAIVVSSGHMQRRNITFIYATWTLSTLAIAGYGLAHFPWQLMVASFSFNFLESAGTIVWVTTKQRMIPSRLLGRVSSIDWLISIGLVPLSYAATGPISAVFGARTTLVGAGVLGAAVTMGAFFLPGMRDMERRDERSGEFLDVPAPAELKAS
jgi:MFS family permease